MKSIWAVMVMAVLFCAPHSVWAQESPEDSGGGLWRRGETLLVLGGLAGAGALSLWDEDIRESFQKNRDGTFDDLGDGLEVLGEPLVSLGIGGALWGYGWWRKDPDLARTGRQAFDAVFIAEATTVLLKYASGRDRPFVSGSSGSFDPFTRTVDSDSFPSGHTSGAFALAAVLSRNTDSSLASWGYYGLATLVGLSRIYQDDHWASDVAVGALIGEVSGRLAMRWDQKRSRRSFAVLPWPSHGPGLQLVARF